MNAYYVGNGTDTITVKDANTGEIIEQFESSGCVYNDLGCCQGCPACRLEDN